MKRVNREGVDNHDETRPGEERDCKRKKRSRWETGDESDKTILNGLPTSIPTGLTKEQEEQYLLQLQIEEITRRLRTGEFGIPKDASKRSPSPEPVYGPDGKRVNTRECRVRKKLEDERHLLILKVLKANPDYKPPNDYKASNAKFVDKVFIPQEENPSINFIGLLLGPRGNTLKQLTQESGAVIVIRGKGSVKEGKLGFKDGRLLPGQDEPLHAYVTSNRIESVQMACEKIQQIIKEGIEIPDTDNELRKQQLRELALLNGTLRDGDALSKLKQLAEAETIITNRIVCSICGGAGHIANDCKMKISGDAATTETTGADPAPVNNSKANLDIEYMSLMAELGQEVPQPTTSSTAMQASGTINSKQMTNRTVANPSTPYDWQSCMPGMWGNGYMLPSPVQWASLPQSSYGIPCYGGIPPFNAMYGQPYMAQAYGNPDTSVTQGYPTELEVDRKEDAPQPSETTPWYPPPPADDFPPPPPAEDMPLPPLPPPPPRDFL